MGIEVASVVAAIAGVAGMRAGSGSIQSQAAKALSVAPGAQTAQSVKRKSVAGEIEGDTLLTGNTGLGKNTLLGG